MSATDFETRFGSPQQLIRMLQDELAESNREVTALMLELEKRVEDRTSALCAAQQELELKNKRLETSNRDLETFTYSVSHDLRAPLRHLQSYAALLADECGAALGDQGREYLSRLCQVAQHMGVLFDELLKFARTSQQPLDRRPIDFKSLVRQVITELTSGAAGRQIDWVVSPLPEVWGDELMLRQVWVNLIGNAVKYTSHRSRARIEVGLCGEQNGEAVFFVRDDGTGFDMKYADKLFNIFQRLHMPSDFEGTGVGLALVRRIIERHGGRVWAESTIGQGATFYFSLPRTSE